MSDTVNSVRYIDAHSDMLSDVLMRRQSGEVRVIARRHLSNLTAGNVEGAICVLWIDRAGRSDYAARRRMILQCMDSELSETPRIRLVTTPTEAEKAANEGKFYFYLGAEGLCGIDEELKELDFLYSQGLRHASLTWNEQNALATGARGDAERGLTELGARAVRRINELGILLDVSHSNDRTFWDIIDTTSAPIIATHSNARALCDVKRNLTDDQIKAVAATGGLIGLNSYPDFISSDPEGMSVDGLAAHARYLADMVGVEHVCCGFDFCSYLLDSVTFEADNDALAGLEDSSKLGVFAPALSRAGFDPREINMIAKENFARLMKRITEGAK